MLAIQIAAEHGDPQDSLPQRWDLRGWFRSAMRVAVQRLPFDRLQQDFARQIFVGSGEQGCIQNAPGDHGKQRGRAYKAIEMAELSLLPAVRRADASTLVIADGTSCRHQIKDGAMRNALHVARALAMSLSNQHPSS